MDAGAFHPRTSVTRPSSADSGAATRKKRAPSTAESGFEPQYRAASAEALQTGTITTASNSPPPK